MDVVVTDEERNFEAAVFHDDFLHLAGGGCAIDIEHGADQSFAELVVLSFLIATFWRRAGSFPEAAVLVHLAYFFF